MSDANQTTNLEQFPDSAIEVVHGKVQRLNRIAMHRFPELRSGMELPGFLSTPLKDPDGAGTFTHQGVLYLFSRVAGTAGSLLLVRPAPKSGLTDRQLDGFVRQMRGFLQEVLLEFQSTAGQEHDSAFNRSFFRMYRLLSNLDFMRGMDSSEGTLFRPVTLDLVGLCRRLTEEAAFLLREAGVQLRFQCRLASLLIPGDPALLQKLLLTLISNGAKAAHPGELVLTLERRGNQAVLRLGDRGEGRCLDDLFPPKEAEARIPAPGDGAGMGLAIARHIVELHQGTLLLGERGGGGSFPRKAFQYGFQLGRAPVYLWRLWGAGGLHPPFRTDDGRLVCHVHGGRGERRFPFCRPVAAMG